MARDLIARGLTRKPVLQTAKNGGTPVSHDIFSRETNYIMIGDFATPQQDINEAAYSGKLLVGDPSAPLSLTSTLTIPANIRADFRQMIIAPNASMTSGYTAQIIGQLGPLDYGDIANLRLSQTLISNHQDVSKTVDGLEIGNSSDYVRQLTFRNMTISGFRDAITFVGNNNFILDFEACRIFYNWRYGLNYQCVSNSGERMSFRGGTLANINNTTGTGTILYIDPAASDPDWYFVNSSLDYSDYIGDISHGHASFVDCHMENNSMNPFFKLSTTSQRTPPVLRIYGGTMGGGPGFSPWAGTATEPACGRPAYITTTGGKNSVIIDQTGVGNYRTACTTEIVKNLSTIENSVIRIRPLVDAGFALTSGSQPLGTGVSPALSYSRNNLYIGTTSATFNTAWTVQNGGWTANTTDMLPGEVFSYQQVESTSTGSIIGQYIPVSDGDMITCEVYVHFGTYTSGNATIRVKQFFDGAGATPATINPDVANIAGVQAASPISSTSATISAAGLFTPGTMQQGTFVVGQMLSGTGIGSGTYISLDNGDGTFNVYNPLGTDIAATTIKGWTKVFYRRAITAGVNGILFALYGQNFVGTALFSKPRVWKH